jgi:glutathione S-transferase
MNTKLIGLLDSPYVRRTAVALQLMEIDFEHLPLSAFTQYYEFSQINPAVKAPTLIIDDGSILMDSGLILQYASVISRNSWSAVPNGRKQRAAHFRMEGLSLVVMDKAVQLVLEQRLRPPDKQHSPWIVRCGIQLSEALDLLEAEVKCHQWDFRIAPPTLAEVTAAVAWTFCKEMAHTMVEKENHPLLSTLTAEAELLECFKRAPHSTLKYPVLLRQSADSDLDLQA